MIKVIINADDLGKSPEVNSAIGDALSGGLINSSTILANSLYWSEIHSIINSNPLASFGIHLNLTEGKALSYSDIFLKYGIVDQSNLFTKNIFKFLNEGCIPTDLLDAIYDEWDKQLNKVINIEKVSITHLDGHHHIHHYYAFSSVLLRLIDKYNIKIIRRRYSYPTSKFKGCVCSIIEMITTENTYKLVLKLKTLSNNKYLSFLETSMESILWMKYLGQYCSTNYFDSYEHFISRIKYGISNDAVIELMCHPGSMKYEHEYSMIKSRTLNSSLGSAPYIYSSFLEN